MAHYAFLNEHNIVVDVITGADEHQDFDGEAIYGAQRGQRCKRTSYGTYEGVHYNAATGEPSEQQWKAFRKNFAGIGYRYDENLDAFIPPKPYPSWILDESTCNWNPPVPRPATGGEWQWSEDENDWLQLSLF